MEKSYRARVSTSSKWILTFLLPILFHLPLITTVNEWPGPGVIGDNFGMWLPYLAVLDFYVNQQVLGGIDFFTQGGASEPFLRVNAPGYNPVILTALLLFDIKNAEEALAFYYGVSFLFCGLSVYYSFRLVELLEGPQAVGTALAILISLGAFQITAQYFVFSIATWSVPFLLFSILSFSHEATPTNFARAVLAVLLILFIGYFPVGLSVLFFCFVAVWGFLVIGYTNSQQDVRSIKGFLITFSPVIFASLIALPGYLSILLRMSAAQIWSPRGIDSVSHDFGASSSQFLKLFSLSFQSPLPEMENEYVFGFLIIISAFLVLISEKKVGAIEVMSRLRTLSFICFSLFLVSWLIVYGDKTALSQIFYAMPGLGEFRIFQRHLVWGMPFLCIGASVMIYTVAVSVNDRRKEYTIAVLVGLLFVTSVLFAAFSNDSLSFGPRGLSRPSDDAVNFGNFGVIRGAIKLEIIYSALAFAALRFIAPARSVPIAAFLVALPALNAAYNLHDLSGSNKIVFPRETRSLIVQHMLQNSESDLVRFADLSPDFSELLPKNHPWLVANAASPRAISSFTGYELHGAIGGEYSIWHGGWAVADNDHHYYSPSWAAMQAVGTEFIIYETDRNLEENPVHDHLDLSDPARVLDIPGTNLRVAPLVYPGRDDPDAFNNGIFQVQSNAVVTAKATNFATRASVAVDSQEPTEVKFLLWPKTNNLAFLVDGVRVKPVIGEDGLALFALPAGPHLVEVKYSNLVNSIFIGLYLTTLIAAFLTMLFAKTGLWRVLQRSIGRSRFL